MSTISLRIQEEKKQKFYKTLKSTGIDSSTALRFFIDKYIENPKIIKFDLDEDLMEEMLLVGENSFKEVWGNKEDDIYSKLYGNV